MRKRFAQVVFALLAVLTLWSGARAQEGGQAGAAQGRGAAAGRGGGGRGGGRGAQAGFVASGVPKMPDPVGPAPKHDFTGTWVGPLKVEMGPYAPFTPAGEAASKRNHAIKRASDNATSVEPNNDPYAICDPLGFPRDLLNHWLSSRGGIEFLPAADRMVMLFEQQHVWREIWTDGRKNPAKVDAPGSPDSRFYGYSVGHWEGDNVFVIDTVGLDPRSWIDEAGLPHTNNIKLQERWTRVDQYNMEATVTVEDPQYFTKPFTLMKTSYYWKKDQNVEEEMCVASEALEYRDRQAGPSGYGYGAK